MATFHDIIGQEQIKEHLQNAISAKKISHAYIINGEKSSGKEFIARVFAMTLQCEKGGTEPCQECHSCKQALSDNQPDIIYVSHEKPNTISVDDIRTQLNNDIVIKPYSSKHKIYIVDEAENGADAFEVLNRESGKVDIILLDLAMPVMDGMEFLKRKQQDAVLAGIPVIIITADDTTGHQIQMLQLGAEDYIVKPFVPEIAMRRVENVLGAGRLLKRMSVAGGKDKGETDNGGTV